MEEFYGSGIVKEEQIQMEIRLLYGNEIQWAVQTAQSFTGDAGGKAVFMGRI